MGRAAAAACIQTAPPLSLPLCNVSSGLFGRTLLLCLTYITRPPSSLCTSLHSPRHFQQSVRVGPGGVNSACLAVWVVFSADAVRITVPKDLVHGLVPQESKASVNLPQGESVWVGLGSEPGASQPAKGGAAVVSTVNYPRLAIWMQT